MKTFSKNRVRHSGRSILIGIGILYSAALIGVASVAHGWVEDHRITRDDASRLLTPEVSDSDFRIVINDEVLSELNRYLGTSEGRDFVKKTIARKRGFEPTVSAAIARYGVPAILDAIPFVESGYRNLPQNPGKPNWGAGLWMFIRVTALKRGIDQTGSRDVWVLIKAGAVNDRNYIAKVMAAALILSNSDRFE